MGIEGFLQNKQENIFKKQMYERGKIVYNTKISSRQKNLNQE